MVCETGEWLNDYHVILIEVLKYLLFSIMFKRCGATRRTGIGQSCKGLVTISVDYTSRRSNQSILKEINPECSLEGLMLKLQYFGHLMTHWKRPWCWERFEGRGRDGNDRGWDGWMASLTQWTWVWASSGRWWRTGRPGMLQSMGSQRIEHDRVTIQQQQQSLGTLFSIDFFL